MKDLIRDIIKDYKSIPVYGDWDRFIVFKNRDYCFLVQVTPQDDYYEVGLGNDGFLKNTLEIPKDTPIEVIERVVTGVADLIPKNLDKIKRHKLILFSDFSKPEFDCSPFFLGDKLTAEFEVCGKNFLFSFKSEVILISFPRNRPSITFHLPLYQTAAEVVHSVERRAVKCLEN